MVRSLADPPIRLRVRVRRDQAPDVVRHLRPPLRNRLQHVHRHGQIALEVIHLDRRPVVRVIRKYVRSQAAAVLRTGGHG